VQTDRRAAEKQRVVGELDGWTSSTNKEHEWRRRSSDCRTQSITRGGWAGRVPRRTMITAAAAAAAPQ